LSAISSRRYHYIGPKELLSLVSKTGARFCISKAGDAREWIAATHPREKRDSLIPATFIIDPDETLWIADRHSEHVVCAAGKDVLAAGEIFFQLNGSVVHVAEITNQSTGYCPEPDCWPVVAAVLDRLKIPRPDFFSVAFVFRRCEACGATNLVKEEIFECVVCNAPLSRIWNFNR
jgi:hypothetical protein